MRLGNVNDKQFTPEQAALVEIECMKADAWHEESMNCKEDKTMNTMMILGVSVIDKKYLYSKNIQDIAMREAAEATREAYGDCYGYAAEDFEHDSYKFMLNARLISMFGIDFNWNRIEKAMHESEDFWNQTLYHDLESEIMITAEEIDNDRVMTAEELAAKKAAYKKAYGVDYDERFFEA